MELNVRIAIPQLVDKNQVYEEIPPVLVLVFFFIFHDNERYIHVTSLMYSRSYFHFL
jgi:hypothetical protein